MKSGIYKLTFKSGRAWIAKTKELDTIWERLQKLMLSDSAPDRLQDEYNISGMPEYEVLLACHEDHIDFLEVLYRAKFRPHLNPATVANDSDLDIAFNNLELFTYSTLEHITLIKKALDSAAAWEKISTRWEDNSNKWREAAESAIEKLTKQEEVIDRKIGVIDALTNIATTLLEVKNQVNKPWYKKLW